MEEEERYRRMSDIYGEQQRRFAAHQVSEIVVTSLRPSWFQKGSTYVFNLFHMAREAGTSILRSSQVRAMSARLQVAGHKGIATAQDVKHKVEVASHKAQETSHDVKVKLQETLESAQGVAHQGVEKVEEVVHKLKDVSLKIYGKVNKVWSNLSENAGLAFAVLEEENERVYRMNSDNETYAVLNGLRVSNLIKELSPEFYKPSCEPTRNYTTKLLEEIERSRRVHEAFYDHTAINNAMSVSLLIEQKFSVGIPLSTKGLVAKEEISDQKGKPAQEIKKPVVPLTASM